jgi:transglutaminase-like putative cysteine protease
VATVVRRLVAIAPTRRGSNTVTARQVIDRSSTSSIPVTQWLDPQGVSFRTEYQGPFGLTETAEADSVEAMNAATGGSLPEEQYSRTIARTQIKLPRARELDYLRLALQVPDTAIAIPDLSGPGQREVSRGAHQVVLEIRRRWPRLKQAAFPVAATAATREYLEPNAYIQSDEPALVALAKRVVGSERNLFPAALKLQHWVADSMHFDLGVVFAPSVEVFERRRGTCVAYATLLATLTRAVGIPSRIAMGYVYVNGMFGGHAWPEVLVGDEWIALDGAIVADGPADAARFAFAWSSLATGTGSLSAGAAAALYGRLEARVEAFGIGSARREVPAGAAPYVLTGNRYGNSWLGIELAKPASFQFTHLDATWPAMSVVTLEGKPGERAQVTTALRKPWMTPAAHARAELEKVAPTGETWSTTVNGRAGWIREGQGRVVLAVPVGLETWVIEVESPNRSALLKQLMSTLKVGANGG